VVQGHPTIDQNILVSQLHLASRRLVPFPWLEVKHGNANWQHLAAGAVPEYRSEVLEAERLVPDGPECQAAKGQNSRPTSTEEEAEESGLILRHL